MRQGRVMLLGALAVAGLALRPASLASQGVDTLRVGERARVAVAGSPLRLTGTLMAIRGDTLVLRDDLGGTQRVLARAVDRAERSLGRRAAHGARHDGVVGLLAGGAVMAMGGAHGMGAGEVAAATLSWGVVGAAVGALRRPERWQPAALPRSASPVIAAAPAAGPTAAGPSIPHTSTVLAPNDLVRFTAEGSGQVSGTVLAMSRDSLLVARGGVALRYGLQDIRRLEVYYGRTARAGSIRAGKVGAVAGGIVGAIVGYGLSQLNPDGGSSRVAGGMAVMGAAGAATGYFMVAPIGRGFPADDWRRVRLSR